MHQLPGAFVAASHEAPAPFVLRPFDLAADPAHAERLKQLAAQLSSAQLRAGWQAAKP